MNTNISWLSRFSWAVTAYNIFVVLWGAYVRATGSGAGCGSHWPLCNGEVIPKPEAVETRIEFIHRATSGLAFLLVLGLLVWVFKKSGGKAQIRTFAVGAMIFMISESLVGAGLVLFEWVAENISAARVIVMGIHLLNTFLLLFFLTLTSWLASVGRKLVWRPKGRIKWWILGGFVGILFMSMAGAVTALGDTLFPAETLAQGIEQDLSPTAHLLVRLRVWHPVLAVGVGLYLYYLVRSIRRSFSTSDVQKYAMMVLIVFGVQLAAGAINLILLAPIWMQIIHLLLATLIWILLTLLFAAILSENLGVQISRGKLA